MSRQNDNSLFSTLEAAVQAFRFGMEGLGSEYLSHFVEDLLLELGNLPAGQLTQMNLVLTSIMEGQARRDFIHVADLLQYELPHLLKDIIFMPSRQGLQPVIVQMGGQRD